jgi:hypothetical protein
MTRTLVVVAAATTVAAWACAAKAADNAPAAAPVSPPSDRPGFSAGALLGFETSGFGFGIGARAGYTLGIHLYLGGEIGYNFGSGGDHVFSLAPEIGYDFGLPIGAPILIRPYIGLGFALVSEGASIQTNNAITLTLPGGTSGAFLVSPGVLGLYDVLPNVFVGADLRVPIYSSGGSASFEGLLTAGYRM